MDSEVSHDEPKLTPIIRVAPISFGNIFSWAHAVLGQSWGTLALAALTLTLYSIVVGFITNLIDTAIFGQNFVGYFSPLSVLHSVFIAAPLSVGPIYIAAQSFRGEPASFADIFIGFRRSRWLV